MKRLVTSLFFVFCPLAAPLLAQTTIGGGTCSSGSLTGTYSVSLTARLVPNGTFAGVFQSTGVATFDGLSAVTINLTANTGQALGTALSWAGTYSVQSNCAGVINVTGGASQVFNVAVYNSGSDFIISGRDANSYTYSGSGNLQQAACSAGVEPGVYAYSATGYLLNGTTISGVQNGSGLIQFSGVSSVTVNVTMLALGVSPKVLTLAGPYSISSNCMGSAVLADVSNNSYALSFSIYNVSSANAGIDVGLAQAGKFLVTGGAHVAFGQPSATAAAKPESVPGNRGGRA
jgi:hypothetical protein